MVGVASDENEMVSVLLPRQAVPVVVLACKALADLMPIVQSFLERGPSTPPPDWWYGQAVGAATVLEAQLPGDDAR